MLNKAQLIGHLGAEPEKRYLPNGTPVAKVSLATNKKAKNKQTGKVNDYVEWHNLVFYGKLADIVKEHLNQGSRIYVEGEMRTRKWHDDKNAVDRYGTEIVVSTMTMLSIFVTARQPEQITTDPRPDEAKVPLQVHGDDYQHDPVDEA